METDDMEADFQVIKLHCFDFYFSDFKVIRSTWMIVGVSLIFFILNLLFCRKVIYTYLVPCLSCQDLSGNVRTDFKVAACDIFFRLALSCLRVNIKL